MRTLTGREVADAGLTGWVHLRDALHTRLVCDWATGLRLVAAVGEAAQAMDHHPDLDLRYDHLDVRLTSHDVDGLSRRDLRLARAVSALAQAEGVSALPLAAQVLEIGLDTPDAGAVLPFWQAVLAAHEVREPAYGPELRGDGLPRLWFQASGRAEPRQRFHLDLWVAPEAVDDRIAAALATGGSLVSDADAPAFWVLADPEGNRLCLCTWQDRDPGGDPPAAAIG